MLSTNSTRRNRPQWKCREVYVFVFGLSAELSPSASTDLRVQIDVSDPMSLPLGPLVARYDKTSNVWTLTGEGLETPITGRTQLQGQGFGIVVTGTPRDNDFFEVKRGASAASNINLLLSKPRKLRLLVNLASKLR